jgi:hypothetical protein
MILKINNGNPITFTSVSMNDTINMTVYTITYNKIDLTPLPTAFTATIETDDGTEYLNEKVSNYVKQVNNNTILTLRIPKSQVTQTE